MIMPNPDNKPIPTLDDLLEIDPKNMGDEELCAYHERLRILERKDIRQILKDEFLEMPEHEGFIYILSNPAMPGLLKIGSTVGPVEKRAADLSRMTGVPEPFKIERAFPVYVSPIEAEKRVHSVFGVFRSRRNREFFRLPVEYAVDAIQAVLDGMTDR